MLKVYIDNNLQELKTKFPTMRNKYNIQDNKYNTKIMKITQMSFLLKV